jgi:protein arginine N-methyltransferase 7
MVDWSEDLRVAAASGDVNFMTAMLARVPPEVLQRAVPYFSEMARLRSDAGELEEAVTCLDQLVRIEPACAEWHRRLASTLLRLDRLPEARAAATRSIELETDVVPGYRLQAQACEGLQDKAGALTAYREVLRREPDDTKVQERVAYLEETLRKQELLKRALGTEFKPATTSAAPAPTRARIQYEPLANESAAIPASLSEAMVKGVTAHLDRYGSLQSPKNLLARIEDPEWLDAWDKALALTGGGNVLMAGSELGLFAIRALEQGASQVLAAERFGLDARIAAGNIHKHMLASWHRRRGDAHRESSEDERRRDFETFSSSVNVDMMASQAVAGFRCDWLVVPAIDHTLVGQGLVRTVRQLHARGAALEARVLPAGARLFAMGIQWRYPGVDFDLRPLNELRWSPYPQPLEASADQWEAVTEAICLGEVDFAAFEPVEQAFVLPATADGTLDAILLWFDLDLGTTRLSNDPRSGLRCIRTAVQHADSTAVRRGEALRWTLHLSETRWRIQTNPPIAQPRRDALPSWYVPMTLDRSRNEAYRSALSKALGARPAELILDIGTGTGLLAMLAAQLGAKHVVGCEANESICRVGERVVTLNGMGETIRMVNKDCRKLAIPADLPRRADLVLFELFDCSLIGEGVLHFLAHAREHLATEGARFLPMGARLRAMLIEHRLDRIWDIDANLLNPYRYSPSFQNVDASRLRYRPLGEPFDVFSFDFSKATTRAREQLSTHACIAQGIAGAVLFWFDLQLDETTWISNAPGDPAQLHWKQGLQFLPEVKVTQGMQLPFVASHNGSSLRFRWGKDLPADALLPLPRFDPRWWEQTSELEAQTAQLLQHCAANPTEHENVTKLAMLLASDPAAHGLDPRICQRFAGMLLGS